MLQIITIKDSKKKETLIEDKNTPIFEIKPNNGGIPATENMSIAKRIANAGFDLLKSAMSANSFVDFELNICCRFN